jgi:hypothetical protein
MLIRDLPPVENTTKDRAIEFYVVLLRYLEQRINGVASIQLPVMNQPRAIRYLAPFRSAPSGEHRPQVGAIDETLTRKAAGGAIHVHQGGGGGNRRLANSSALPLFSS